MSSTMTPAELATHLGVNVRTIQRWARERRIPHLRIGGRTIRFLPAHLEQIEAAYTQTVSEMRPEATIRNDRFRPYMQVVPMRSPNDAA